MSSSNWTVYEEVPKLSFCTDKCLTEPNCLVFSFSEHSQICKISDHDYYQYAEHHQSCTTTDDVFVVGMYC